MKFATGVNVLNTFSSSQTKQQNKLESLPNKIFHPSLIFPIKAEIAPTPWPIFTKPYFLRDLRMRPIS